MNLIGLQYNITDNSYCYDITNKRDYCCIAPKNILNVEYDGPIEEEINARFIITSNPYISSVILYKGYNNKRFINIVSTNTGYIYRVLYFVNNVLVPIIIPSKTSTIVHVSTMKDGDVAEVITWKDDNYSHGTIVKRVNMSLINLHEDSGSTYLHMFNNNNNDKRGCMVRILSKGTLIVL